MLNETIRISIDDGLQMSQIAQLLTEPNESRPASVADDSFDLDSYARAIQALRDVRHLLPREGVAIVDEVLGYAA